jgi:hypothetical protein
MRAITLSGTDSKMLMYSFVHSTFFVRPFRVLAVPEWPSAEIAS